jgi:hypothetical protein
MAVFNAPVRVWRTVCLIHRFGWLSKLGWMGRLSMRLDGVCFPTQVGQELRLQGGMGSTVTQHTRNALICAPCTVFLRHSSPGCVSVAAPASEPDAVAHKRWRLKNAFLPAAAPSLWNESQHNACGKNRLDQLVTTSVVAAQDHGDAQS